MTPAKRAVVRYIVSLHEALLPPQEAQGIWDDMARLVQERPSDMAEWFALVTHSVLGVLPPGDPIRSLSGVYLSRRVSTPGCPSGDRGAYDTHGLPFGTWTDAVDLRDPLYPDDPTCDVGFAAVAHGMIPEDAALIAIAGHYCEETLVRTVRCLGEAWGRLEGVENRHEAVWTQMDAVLRRIIHRLRQYVTVESPWLAEAMQSLWARVEDPEGGHPTPDQWVRLGRIDPETYAVLARAHGGSAD